MHDVCEFLRDSMIQSGCTSSITNPIKCSHSARCFWTYGMAWGCTSSFSIKHLTSNSGPFRARNAQIYQGECSRTTSGEFSLENGCSPFSIVVNLWLFNLFVGSPLQQPHAQQWYTACTRPLICPFTASNVPGLRKERETHRCARFTNIIKLWSRMVLHNWIRLLLTNMCSDHLHKIDEKLTHRKTIYGNQKHIFRFLSSSGGLPGVQTLLTKLYIFPRR